MNDVLYYSSGMYCTCAPVLFDCIKPKLYLLEYCSTVSMHQKQLEYMFIVESTSLKAASTMQYMSHKYAKFDCTSC